MDFGLERMVAAMQREAVREGRERSAAVRDRAQRLVLGAVHRVKFLVCEAERRVRAIEWNVGGWIW
jgi:hypothetical protein